MLKSTLFGLMLALVLVGCGDKERVKVETGNPVPEDAYNSPAGNLLINPDFELGSRGNIEAWHMSQHGGASSYVVTRDDAGIVTIARTGKEPWGALRQVLNSSAMVPLEGKRLRLSAEISGDFNSEYGPPFQPAGLSVLLKGVSAGSFAQDILLDQTEPLDLADHQPHWRRYAIDFDVPETGVASRLELRVYFLMTRGGEMRIRRPYLIELDSE